MSFKLNKALRFNTWEHLCVFFPCFLKTGWLFVPAFRFSVCCIQKEPLNVTYGRANKPIRTLTQRRPDRNTHWLSNKAAIMEAGVWSGEGGVCGALSSQEIMCMHTHIYTTHNVLRWIPFSELMRARSKHPHCLFFVLF